MNCNNKIGYVYLIHDNIHNKNYVGQKLSPVLVENYWGSGKYIKNAINKYGLSNFSRTILCWCFSKVELNEKELYYIKEYDCLAPNGYNQTLNVFASGLKQQHSQGVKEKISITRRNFSKEKQLEIYKKFKETINNRSPEKKLKLSNKLSLAIKNSEKWNNTIHSKEYAEKQSNIQKEEYIIHPERKEKISKKSKENWKNKEYRERCIKNLNHENSEIQAKRGIIGNLNNTTKGFIEYNKSEKGKNNSRKAAKRMQEKLKNMSKEEFDFVKLQTKVKRILNKEGEDSLQYQELLSQLQKIKPEYDPWDSAKDRFLNNKFPKKKIIKKQIIDLKEPIDVYDLTVKNQNLPNFQLASQIYGHNCPGGGKSKTMAYLTHQALSHNKRVIFFTLELSEIETMANINCAITGFNMYDMMRPENRAEFTHRLMMFKNTYNPQLVVKFYKPGCVNADTLQNFTQKVIQKKIEQTGISDWKPDIIFVDYLDKLLPTQKVKGNMYEDIGGVATDLKNLGITFDCPVISGSQLGRYTWSIKGDQVVNMDAIAESSQKIHLAHSLTTLNANPAEKEQHKVRLFLAKSRSGIPGRVIYCNNDLGRCTLTEAEPWDPNNMITTATFTIKDTNLSTGKK